MLDWARLLLPPFLYVFATVLLVGFIWEYRRELRALLATFTSASGSDAEVGAAVATVAAAEDAAIRLGRLLPHSRVERERLTRIAQISAPFVPARRILWVDDRPHDNQFERRAFRMLRIEVVNCLGTREALDALRRDDYDLIVSDMGRENDPEDDGWVTLRHLRHIKQYTAVPVIFYHGDHDDNPKRDIMARAAGAVGATTSPGKLFQWALFALLRKGLLDNDELRYVRSLVQERESS
ncbi:MAG: response regulator receiver protein [Proteobacteria bacterium]|nr:response regulator receiver protein [Pseudomonadota bacterium]